MYVPESSSFSSRPSSPTRDDPVDDVGSPDHETTGEPESTGETAPGDETAASDDGAPAEHTGPMRRTWPAWFLAGAILLLAFNLRPAVASLGAVLDEVRAGLHLSAGVAGVLTTLPVLCFAFFGAAAAGWSRRFGSHHVLAAATGAILVGLAGRAVSPTAAVLLIASALTLAGMAVANVLIPAFVKAHFPGRVGAMTAAYTTMLAVGTCVPAAVTVPISHALGGWRAGLGIWAIFALVTLVPWILLARSDHASRRRQSTGRHLTLRDIARSKLAWCLALYFGLQSTQAYAVFGWLAQVFRDAGLDAAHAGLLLAIVPACGIPMSLVFPSLAARMRHQTPIVVTCGVAYFIGYGGLLLAPGPGALVWALMLGIGGGAFPLALTMIALRSREHEVTARLSGFTQSVGYLIAAAGPLAVGAVFGATGGWTAPLGLLLALVVPQMIFGVIAARGGHVDDQLRTTASGN